MIGIKETILAQGWPEREELSTFVCYFLRINGLICVWLLKYKMAKKIPVIVGNGVCPPPHFWIFLIAQSYYVTIKNVRPRGEVV